MRYLYELVDVSRSESIEESRAFPEFGECLYAASRRATRFPPNTLIRFDFYGPGGEHVVSMSVAALQQALRQRWS